VQEASAEHSGAGLAVRAAPSMNAGAASEVRMRKILIAGAGRESAIYLLDGEVEMFWGDEPQHSAVMHQGDFVYVPVTRPAQHGSWLG
jgi:uncharacterized RmlC-like cupin family protein